MGYNTANGRYADTVPVTFSNGVLSATATGAAVEFGDRNSLRLDLVISAATGTSPTLDVAVQTSPDGTTWTAVAAFAQQTGAATVRKLFAPLDRFVRVVETLGGTASPTFTRVISGEAV